MFIVVYSFEPKAEKETEFINLWKDLTKVIFEHCNSFGSRLHKDSNGKYIAYAQWPNEQTFETAILPAEFNPLRGKLKEICTSKILYKMYIEEDLLKK